MIQFLKDYKLPIGIILVIVLCSFGGGAGWKYHKATIQQLEEEKLQEIAQIQLERDSLQLVLEDGFAKDEELADKIADYKYLYYNEKRNRLKAERLLKDINNRTYSYSYLDSLGANIEYPKN